MHRRHFLLEHRALVLSAILPALLYDALPTDSTAAVATNGRIGGANL